MEAVIVGDGTAQRSSVERLVVEFDDVVDTVSDTFAVTNREDGSVVEITLVTTATVGGRTYATIRFGGPQAPSGMLGDGNYVLRIDGTKVTRVAGGDQLDGNRNATPGGEFVFGDEAVDGFFRLYGDVSGDRTVALGEFALFRSSFGKSAADNGFLVELDSDGDGVIGLRDFAQFRSRFGRGLGF